MPKSFQRLTLNVALQHIDPPIWRQIEVEGTESLRKLHHILQAAFGWEDTHLHDLIDCMTYAMFEVDDVADFADPDTTADDRKDSSADSPEARFALRLPIRLRRRLESHRRRREDGNGRERTVGRGPSH